MHLPALFQDEETCSHCAQVDVCDDDVEVEFEEESGRSTIVDPVNELLDYILEYSDADVAVASDKDVDALFNDTRAALCDLSPKVVVDEHGAGRICLEPSSSDFVRDVQASNGDPGERFGQVTSCCSDTTTTDTNQIDRFFNAMLRLGQEALSTLLGESSRTSGSSNATSIKESGGADIAQSPYGNNVEQRNNPQPPSVMDEPKIISSQRWGQKSRSDSLTTAHEAASASSPSVLSAEVPTPSFETQKSMYQHNPQLPPDFDVQSRQHPPSIHTDNFPYPDPGDFMPSPVSSPADDPIAPQSHYARQLSSSSLSPRHDESEASGSDVSATELPSPTHQAYPSPTTQRGTIPGSRPLQSPQGSASASSLPGSDNSKTYSFASLPGIAMKKSPRRRYDEIERLYQCSWPNCTKAYGTLNHLNAHITTQRHGPKRTPNEFKELRKEWRQENKKAEEAERERERAEQAQLIAGRDMTMQDVGPSWTDSPTQRPAPTCEPAQVYDGSLTLPSPQ
ncbi:hypothetical protein L227DRAFT_64958 [Lentinus tigrinus ALCF2SS1-6]|uniref:C2H2-type domain-containing protein n=1 Tax=Lentinus tigrinus ALCF2SS1-6 TaxID=1328759 RepID=A0A5C2SBX2_9APHY|nr:hypothetical protein L227DRAFT_64958 [Lentinus tigrinus ALCF2SS1-6]